MHNYQGQNPISSTKPINPFSCRSQGWWSVYTWVALGLYAFGFILGGARVIHWIRMDMAKVMSIRWRRLKRIIGIRRGVNI